ncbi:MAG TPA: spore coat protein [Bacillales bacterium]|nr:spore coat protein [Bacillales bacterium]
MYGSIRPIRSERKNCKWSALDANSKHPMVWEDAEVVQGEEVKSTTHQYSEEQIIVKDSADVEIHTTDTQAAVALQAALQVGIALAISITIGDSEKADKVAQDLLAKVRVSQSNRQQTYIENSRGVNITTTDTDLAVNIQLLLQVLVAILVKLDIL